MTCADISLFPYTRLAHEGGFDLAKFPAVATWVARVDAELGLIRPNASSQESARQTG